MAFDPILKRVAFRRQALSDLIDAGSTLSPAIAHQLAYLVFVADHDGLLATLHPNTHQRGIGLADD